MNHIATTPPATIRARIHESALKRVSRIYASTLSDAITEALQNSRRANATHVRITIDTLTSHPLESTPETSDPLLTVTIADDGAGISNPAVLLSFGENGWSDDLVQREDASGFGFASLSRRGCTVLSRPHSPDGTTMPGWRVDLAPKHFLGEADAKIHTDNSAPYQHGTSISFPATETAATIRYTAETAARHYPLPVFFDGLPRTNPGGEQLERRVFLDGALHAEPWRGLAFGIFKNSNRSYDDPDLNFFGLTLPVHLPTVETVHNGTWNIRADIGDCPQLELVLPARKEAVENAFLKEMREAARLAIYSAMASALEPRPTFDDWNRARHAGIDIAPPPAQLRPWRPTTADVDDYWREPSRLAIPSHGALVMDYDPEPPQAQAFWRAADRAGLATSLFHSDPRLAGFDWYDSLDRITNIATLITTNDDWSPLDDFPLPDRTILSHTKLPPRPSAIRMDLSIQTAPGRSHTFELPADCVFASEPFGWLGDTMPLVTADSTIQPHQLAELLQHGFFSPSDDPESDSYQTQQERFSEEALHLATRLLLSDDEACRNSISETIRRELLWLCPRGRTVEISVTRPDITVTLHDATETAPSKSPTTGY